MRVALDVQISETSTAGIGQFAAAVRDWLPRVDPTSVYLPLRPGRPRQLSMPERWWWDQVSVPRAAARQRADVLFKPAFSVPIRSRVPTVVFVHDLAARRFPEQLHRPSAWFFGRWLPWTLRFTRRILAASAFTADELASELGLRRDRIVVAYQGYASGFQPAPDPNDEHVRARHRLPERFVLHVGTIEPRKRLAFLVRSFARFRQHQPAYGLVLAGAPGWQMRDVEAAVTELGLEQAVYRLGAVGQDELAALYRLARVVAFPSRYEGFGRPPLEAIASGTPVVASRIPATAEVVGQAGLLLDAEDEAAWSAALEAAAEDEATRTRLRAAGLAQAQRFQWSACAQTIAGVLHEVVDG